MLAKTAALPTGYAVPGHGVVSPQRARGMSPRACLSVVRGCGGVVMGGHPRGPHAVLVLVGAYAVRGVNVIVRSVGRLFGPLAFPLLAGKWLWAFSAIACNTDVWGRSFYVDRATQAFGRRKRV